MTSFPALNPPIRTLLGPGPSDIHPRVLQAIGKNTVGHLDPYYLQLMDASQKMLRALFRTENRMTFSVSATGSAGMEATVVNLIEPGDSMIVCVNGVFGGSNERCRRAGGCESHEGRTALGRSLLARGFERRVGKVRTESGRHRHGRDVDGCVAADRRDCETGA